MQRLDPIFAALAPGDRRGAAHARAQRRADGTAEQGYLHCGPERRRPLREDGPQRHRVRPDGRLRRGAQHPAPRQRRASSQRDVDAETTPLRDPEHYQYDLDLRDDRRGVAARQRHRLVAARPDGRGARRRAPSSASSPAACPTPARAAGRCTAAIDEGVPAPVLSAALFERFSSRGEADFADKVLSAMRTSSAATRRRPRPNGGAMTAPRSDALVFFGATGDLAYKQIFPALQAMVRRGHLDVPVIGVARSGWTLEQLRAARARQPRAARRRRRRRRSRSCAALLRYVDGDYGDPATFERLRSALGDARAPAALPGDPAQPVRDRRRGPRPRRAAPTARASSSRSRSAATSPRRRS